MADGVRSPLAVFARVPIPGTSDEGAPGASVLIYGAFPGFVGILMLATIGVALGYRRAKRQDGAGVNLIRFMS
ncbi:hypothetical protein [Mycolicibacterium sp. CBMA 226]|uniref:hypothetical protein n=1 Tax=Mycolicibacterium sp. CBMA 226 TaxID=2606611 RepID=UPI0012DF370E|nr:hypothetical protein [Mycolicibacterium sp. CBMA 226]MUL78112.1 hypothetical protein [Mycolicibacterium sp. CBMA 226]